jgi:phosphoribosylaminoimidazole-succinocarboxamide synthase
MPKRNGYNNPKEMEKTLTTTNFQLPGQAGVYHGKVRDVYDINNDILVMVASDRISAFDVVLPEGIPYKGQVLNQIAAYFLDATSEAVPNWKIAVPDPAVTVGYRCEGFRVEMIIRGYLAGSAWREYAAGAREICGVKLPEGLRENERLPEPIITPTTKAEAGHDENISREEIIARGIVSEADYIVMEEYTRRLFEIGTKMAAEKGLILVDTKYEFGKRGDKVLLIDEVHTPDSSRYFYAEGYEERLAAGQPQRQLSKEFVRQWLMENGFMGRQGEKVPEMTPEVCRSISERYIELYEHVTGQKFVKAAEGDAAKRMEANIIDCLNKLNK